MRNNGLTSNTLIEMCMIDNSEHTLERRGNEEWQAAQRAAPQGCLPTSTNPAA